MTMSSLTETTMENYVLRKELVKQVKVKNFYVQNNTELGITSKPNTMSFLEKINNIKFNLFILINVLKEFSQRLSKV